MPTIKLTDEQHDALVGCLQNLLDMVDREDFESRHDFFAFIGNINDLLDAVQRGK